MRFANSSADSMSAGRGGRSIGVAPESQMNFMMLSYFSQLWILQQIFPTVFCQRVPLALSEINREVAFWLWRFAKHLESTSSVCSTGVFTQREIPNTFLPTGDHSLNIPMQLLPPALDEPGTAINQRLTVSDFCLQQPHSADKRAGDWIPMQMCRGDVSCEL